MMSFWKGASAKRVAEDQLSLTTNQIGYIDRFSVASTRKFLELLETTFMLHIDSSSSHIEIMPTNTIEKIEQLSSGPLYVISSGMTGELQGGLHLLMRPSDFKNLGEVMKPTLEFLFLSNVDANLGTLESQKPNWMQEHNESSTDDSAFPEQLMDALTEMGNSLFGIYTNAFYKTYDLYTHHSSIKTFRVTDQKSIQQVLLSPGMMNKQHFVVENELIVSDHHIKLWCLISPTQKSFQEILNRIG